MEGVNGFLVANDVKGIGHYTTYPSDKETVALQVPFEGGIVPEHKVLRRGACHKTLYEVIEGDKFETDGSENGGQVVF